MNRTRARGIVLIAASRTEVESVKDWFIRDERGTWEEDALKMIAETADDAAELKLSPEEVDSQIAARLLQLALGATHAVMERGG